MMRAEEAGTHAAIADMRPADPAAFLRLDRTVGAIAVTAVVSRRAAALRLLQVGGTDIVEPTTSSIDPPGMAGAILAPWPNRVAGARWWLDGIEQHLHVTEPDLGNANHGLLAGTDFAIQALSDEALTLAATVSGQEGYPFTIEVAVSYRLLDDGIAVDVCAHNLGTTRAPVALGAHPYLRVGDVPTEHLRMSLHADRRWLLNEGHIPSGRTMSRTDVSDLPVARSPRHATFEASAPGPTLTHEVAAPDGRRVRLTADPAYRFTQLWIPDDLPTDHGPRQAIAIEPMTAPPNALRTGVGLHWVEPGAQWTTRWCIRLSSTTPTRVSPCTARGSHGASRRESS